MRKLGKMELRVSFRGLYVSLGIFDWKMEMHWRSNRNYVAKPTGNRHKVEAFYKCVATELCAFNLRGGKSCVEFMYIATAFWLSRYIFG